MIDSETLMQVQAASAVRRLERRRFLRTAGAASLVIGGASLLAACGSDDTTADATASPTPSPSSTDTLHDQDTFNFALNLEYLEAQFYSYAVTGAGIPQALLTKGDGNQTVQGAVVGGRKVTFTDPLVAQYAAEIAADEIAHVAFLRSALGAAAVAQPALNIDGSATGAFTAAARAAGIATTNGVIDNVNGTFDPYASDENFLLAAFLFEDVGVTAYEGAVSIINTTLLLDAAAGILATEAYHAGLIRTTLYSKGVTTTPSLLTSAQQISDARDNLDGPTDDDQGIGDATTANLVPTDATGLVYTRTPGQVLNVVYLNSNAVVGGGFFPNGFNGNIMTSAASNTAT